ncbi:helix-turn-helix domain-containing protein [Peribacillus frigoritolerans]|uniref:helix-turn-helix domain-containing protein n=1 Tax=Peribacillus frigoritolerans TaxID=450367 RepID=UPI003F82084D
MSVTNVLAEREAMNDWIEYDNYVFGDGEEEFEEMSDGEWLRYNRELHGLSLRDMQTLFAIDRSSLSKYENDKKEPTPWHKMIFADFLAGTFDEKIEDYVREKHQSKGSGYAL